MYRKSSNAVEKLRSTVVNEHFDAVIDFSAYDSDVVKDISTDSVYEVGKAFFLRRNKDTKNFDIGLCTIVQ